MVRRYAPVVAATAVLLVPLAAACGGDGGGTQPALADAPKATTTPTPSARPVVIVVDGKKTETTTTGTTVREVLTGAGVTPGKHHYVEPPMDSPAEDKIKVVNLLKPPVTKKVKIDPKVRTKKNKKLAPWSEKVLRKGKPGLKEVTYGVVKRRGKKKRIVVAQTVTRKPKAQVVAVGPQPTNVGGTADTLNWAGLAKCESGGRPNAVNPAGYYGLYQFSLQTWGSVGGTGLPSNAPAGEQTYRAKLLYNKVNGRWQGQWPNCGRFL